MNVGDFYYYAGTATMVCKKCKTAVKANRNMFRIHNNVCSGSLTMPAMLQALRTVHTVPKLNTSWKTPLYDRLHVAEQGTVTVDLKVCRVCGKGFNKQLCRYTYPAHVKKCHVYSTPEVEGKGFIKPRSSVQVVSLNDEVLEKQVRRMQSENVVVLLNSVQKSYSVFQHDMNIDLGDCMRLPTRMPVFYYDYTKPSEFDLGLWRFGDDMSKQRLKEAYDLVSPPCSRTECEIAGAVLHILELVPGLVLHTPSCELLKLTQTRIRGRSDIEVGGEEVEEYLQVRRSFGNVLPETLERYSAAGVALVLAMYRYLLRKQPDRLKQLHDLQQVVIDDVKKRFSLVARMILPFILGFLKEKPTEIKKCFIIIFMKGLQVKRKPLKPDYIERINQEEDENEDYEYYLMKPGKMSSTLAAVRYCLISFVLAGYWCPDYNQQEREALVEAWNTSPAFNEINKLLYEARKYTEPAGNKPILVFDEYRNVAIKLKYGFELTIEEFRNRRDTLIVIIEDKIKEIFQNEIISKFLDDNCKFVVRDDKVTYKKEPTDEDWKNILVDDKIDDLTLTEKLNSIRTLILTLCDCFGSASRRAAEYRDLSYASTSKTPRALAVNPDEVTLYDSRLIGKRPGSFKVAGRFSRIFYDCKISHFLMFVICFVNKYLRIKAAKHLIFPLQSKPKRKLFKKQFKKLEDQLLQSNYINDIYPRGNDQQLFSLESYSSKYLEMINTGLQLVYDQTVLSITHQTHRQIISILQDYVQKTSEKNEWKDFMSTMQEKVELKDYYSNMNGHSTKTRHTYYMGAIGFDDDEVVNGDKTIVKEWLASQMFTTIIYNQLPVVITRMENSNMRILTAKSTSEALDATKSVRNLDPRSRRKQELLLRKLFNFFENDKKLYFFVCLRCGSGKTIVVDFILGNKQPEDFCVVIVPTRALALQYEKDFQHTSYSITRFRSHGFIDSVKYDLIIVVSDTSFSNEFSQFMFAKSKNVSALVFDEAHTLFDSAFRRSFVRASYLLRFKQRMLFLSGTLTETLKNCFLEKFSFRKEQCSEHVDDVINNELTLTFKEIKQEKELKEVALSEAKNNNKVLIFISSTKLVDECYEDCNLERKWKLHSQMENMNSSEPLFDFKRSNRGVLFATSAVGEGLNVPDLQHVIIIGTTFSLLKLVQFAARARKRNPVVKVYWQRRTDSCSEIDELTLVPINYRNSVAPLLSNEGFYSFCECNTECRLQHLHRLFHEKKNRINNCGRCDNCQNSSNNYDADISDISSSNPIDINNLIIMLNEKCLVCGSKDCSGLPCRQFLHIIEGSRHGISVKTCFNCYEKFQMSTRVSNSKKAVEKQHQSHVRLATK